MRFVTVLFIPIGFLACIGKNADDRQSKQDVILPNIDSALLHRNQGHKKLISKDTVIIYSIEGLSTEGSEAKVHYLKNSISDAEWRIFGETGQRIIQYKFFKNGLIHAFEKLYTYKSGLLDIKTNEDIVLKDSLRYQLDTNGNIVSKYPSNGFVNVFPDFKKKIALYLNP